MWTAETQDNMGKLMAEEAVKIPFCMKSVSWIHRTALKSASTKNFQSVKGIYHNCSLLQLLDAQNRLRGRSAYTQIVGYSP